MVQAHAAVLCFRSLGLRFVLHHAHLGELLAQVTLHLGDVVTGALVLEQFSLLLEPGGELTTALSLHLKLQLLFGGAPL